MEIKGKLVGVTKDYVTGLTHITFSSDNSAEIEAFCNKANNDKPLRIKAVEWHEKRSLDANAYFHLLVGKIADALGVSKTSVKNEMITSYGQVDMLNERAVTIISNIPVDKMMEQEILHCKAIGVDFEDGYERIEYMVYRGSHTYDYKEMSVLIDGTVQQAKELGIETLSQDEIERIKSLW